MISPLLAEIFAITDVESGEVVQGSLEPRQVTHKVDIMIALCMASLPVLLPLCSPFLVMVSFAHTAGAGELHQRAAPRAGGQLAGGGHRRLAAGQRVLGQVQADHARHLKEAPTDT